MITGKLPYEEAAERKENLSGWVCKTCGQYWGDEERAARWCHALDKECDEEGCKERTDKSRVMCEPCWEKKCVARWKALPEVKWDGGPLNFHDDDTFFFDADELDLYLEEHGVRIEDLRLVVCVPEHKPHFDVRDHLEDYLPEGYDCDDPAAINEVVNDWIEQNTPQMWVPGKTRPSLGSLKPLFVKG